jgi:pantothenate kinase
MSQIAGIAATIFKRAGKAKRFVVGIAGPPGSGKSTLAEGLREVLPDSAVVSMDGFHFDDGVLERRGLRARKGAPETFDHAGFAALLRRLASDEPEIAFPVFDRTIELSRAGAGIVDAATRFVLVEGNYLLLDEAPWSGLAGSFDFTIFIDVPRDELERRLLSRWHEHGRSEEDARAWVDSNDLPNVDRVLARRLKPDLVV